MTDYLLIYMFCTNCKREIVFVLSTELALTEQCQVRNANITRKFINNQLSNFGLTFPLSKLEKNCNLCDEHLWQNNEFENFTKLFKMVLILNVS